MRQGIRKTRHPHLWSWGLCLLVTLGALPARSATLIAELRAAGTVDVLPGDTPLRTGLASLGAEYSF